MEQTVVPKRAPNVLLAIIIFCRGSISISGLALPLKKDFVRLLREGALDDAVHYFVALFKYRHRVIATQMLSTVDGVSNGRLVFPNLINMRDLDFDFQVCR